MRVKRLSDILADPETLKCLSSSQVAPILMELSALQTALAARLATMAEGNGQHLPERLLTAPETAQRLGVSTDWVYRHADQLNCKVGVGRNLRFHERGLDRYIIQRAGR